MDLVREKLTQAEELILQLIAFEKIKAFSSDKIRDAYDAAFSAFNKLRKDMLKVRDVSYTAPRSRFSAFSKLRKDMLKVRDVSYTAPPSRCGFSAFNKLRKNTLKVRYTPPPSASLRSYVRI